MREPERDWFGTESDPDVATRLAAFYDLDVGLAADVAFYRGLARRTGGPILELACGTGRVAVPLARDGHRVVGLDTSGAMLERAKRRAETARVSVELVSGDMRDFALPEAFALVLIPAASFLILPPAERPACLARAREHLAGDGLFVLDVFQPDPEVIAGKQGQVVHEWTKRDPETGHVVTKTSSSDADVEGVDFSFVYDEIDAAGIVRRFRGGTRLHYAYRRELELLLGASGFALQSLYGDYELGPVSPHSPRLLAVARRREREERERRAQ